MPTLDTSRTSGPSAARERDLSRICIEDGVGGKRGDELLRSSFLPRLGNETLNELLDSGVMRQGNQRLAFSIDSYTVRPLFFAGGDIGRLAICGTVNDLAVSGARPIAVAVSFILAGGLERSVLDAVLDSMSQAARESGVRVIAGDTKVVAADACDGMFVTTAGIGVIARRIRMHPSHVMPGDALIITGPIADHGVAVLLARRKLRGENGATTPAVRSDVAPVNRLVELLLKRVPGVVYMRDVTRGGLAGLCAALATRTGSHIRLDESQIPISGETRRAAELLGVDPLEVPNQGKVLVAVRSTNVQQALTVLRSVPEGAQAQAIGQVEHVRDGVCELCTLDGGNRVLERTDGDILSRVC